MEIGRHRGMIVNAHINIGSNSYEKVKTFKYLSSLLKHQNSIQEEIKCRLKQEIHVIIQSKCFCLLRISKLKCIKQKYCKCICIILFYEQGAGLIFIRYKHVPCYMYNRISIQMFLQSIKFNFKMSLCFQITS